MLIIDEISLFTRVNIEKLDGWLKNALSQQDLPYTGVCIIFSIAFINWGQSSENIMVYSTKEIWMDYLKEVSTLSLFWRPVTGLTKIQHLEYY